SRLKKCRIKLNSSAIGVMNEEISARPQHPMNKNESILHFDAGTLLLEGADSTASVPSAFQWDERVRRWRAPAIAYRQVVTELVRKQIPHKDEARQYLEFEFQPKLHIEPRPYQQEAIKEWNRTGKRGVIVLPTGAGKSHVAQMAIELVK